jgi:hypothetical protein
VGVGRERGRLGFGLGSSAADGGEGRVLLADQLDDRGVVGRVRLGVVTARIRWARAQAASSVAAAIGRVETENRLIVRPACSADARTATMRSLMAASGSPQKA